METNDVYLATMYAKGKNIIKIIRMFLATPIIENSFFSSKPVIKGFKEALTDTILTKGTSNIDINNKNILWEISNRKAISIIPEAEITKYINMDKEEMKKLLNESIEEASRITTNSNIKIKTK